jgi:hypothetical protein
MDGGTKLSRNSLCGLLWVHRFSGHNPTGLQHMPFHICKALTAYPFPSGQRRGREVHHRCGSTSAAIALHNWRRISGTLVVAHVTAPRRLTGPPRSTLSMLRRGRPCWPFTVQMHARCQRAAGPPRRGRRRTSSPGRPRLSANALTASGRPGTRTSIESSCRATEGRVAGLLCTPGSAHLRVDGPLVGPAAV